MKRGSLSRIKKKHISRQLLFKIEKLDKNYLASGSEAMENRVLKDDMVNL